MKWKRIKPGQYEKHGANGGLLCVVERSSSRPWAWWWWDTYSDRGGLECSLSGAKRAAEAADGGAR